MSSLESTNLSSKEDIMKLFEAAFFEIDYNYSGFVDTMELEYCKKDGKGEKSLLILILKNL